MIEEIKIDRLEELIQEMMKKIHDSYPIESAEGNPIEINNAAAAPLVKCVSAITGYQEGSGAPSPVNVRPIHGYNACTITVKDEDEVTHQTSTASFANTIYRGSADLVGGTASGEWIVAVINSFTGAAEGNGFRTGEILPNVSGAYGELYCNMFDRATSYNEATSQYGTASSRNKIGFNSNGQIILNAYVNDAYVSTVSELNALIPEGGCVIAYKVATPTSESITLSNSPVKSLHGYSSIESSTGDMEIEYVKKGFQGIVDLIPEIKVNSSGEATATLSKLEVDDVIYGLPE